MPMKNFFRKNKLHPPVTADISTLEDLHNVIDDSKHRIKEKIKANTDLYSDVHTHDSDDINADDDYGDRYKDESNVRVDDSGCTLNSSDNLS